MTVTWLGVFSPLGARAAEPISIQEFVSQRENWPEFAKTKKRLTLEGRIERIMDNGQVLTFTGCPKLTFHPTRGRKFLPLSRPDRTFEVTGFLVEREGRLLFAVEDGDERSSDLETYEKRKRLLRDAEGWYALGNWADVRSAFYRDAKLAEAARQANLRGLELERQDLPEGNADALLQLAVKAEELKLPDELQWELQHEGYQLLWKAVPRDDVAALEAFAARIAGALTGSLTPLELNASEWKSQLAAYLKAPNAVYTAADAQTRLRLHRLFYLSIVQPAIELEADPEGKNGFEVAEILERRLPELSDLAQQYRERELQYRLQNVAALTEQELLGLAARFEKYEQPQQAAEAKKQWLQVRSQQLRKEGPVGLVRAADHYQRLLADDETAALLLIEAHKLNPESTEVAERLNKLGYALHQGRWRTADEIAGLPVGDVLKAVQQGRVLKNMTRDQVKAAKAGQPTSVSRIASARHIIEVWVYEQDGHVIQFVSRRGTVGDEPKVVSDRLLPR